MNENDWNETDLVLAKRIKECVAGKELSPDFRIQFLAQTSRARRLGRLKIAALIALFLAGCLLIVGLTHAGHHVPSRESALVSTDGSPGEREVSGFLFLGLFKECMRRGRKEDEKKESK